jgi:hypothetical protein
VRRTAAVVVVAALLVSACGEEEREAPAPKPVRLSLTGPGDGAVIDGDRVQVTGTVAPGAARVLVRGEPAEVSDGRFSADVALDPGANVVDISAAATGRSPALAALRLVRQMPVEIPDLSGVAPDEAVARLEGLGLRPELREGGGLFDDLRPGTVGVCGTDPEAGEQVRPGTFVEVEVAKVC